jgi:hypothetical protein
MTLAVRAISPRRVVRARRIINDGPFFMSYVRGEDRGRAALLPPVLEVTA